MSTTRNILANYVSQIYVTIIGIVMVPLFLKYMGAEAYGLIGFFAMLQAWFALLDMGLSTTIARETARFNGGATDALNYRRLVRALEGIFLTVAISGGIALYSASGYIANHWLKATELPLTELQSSLELMAIIIALRWMCGLYRGTISGSERLVWLGGYNSLIATLRFVLVLPTLMLLGTSPTVFFSYQCGIAVIELVGLLIFAYQLLPTIPKNVRLPWQWDPLKPVLKFSLAIAFTSSVWVLVTQTDKLVLSNILPLAEYGYFTLAVLVASGILVINGPVSAAIMPRMSKMEAEGNHDGLIILYRKATQFVAVLAGSTSVTIACCAEPLLWAWTGDHGLAQQSASVLTLYALGNGALAVAAFPYYLQYAKGDLRIHLINNAVFMVLMIPAIVLSASQYGSVGAGWVWLVMNLLPFVTWLPLVHHKFEPGLNLRWYGEDIFAILIPIMVFGYLSINYLPISLNRLTQFAYIMLFNIMLLFIGIFSSSTLRPRVINVFKMNAHR